ncbi:MAG: 16S rRNA (guanine(527)-N(7))-methyltransferase RsmG, partial [Leptospiraceae bacterium]|nr:16S rRNA (guanine(527)-N(7))-methyltransferase RsmG [Leptospiraceae bacterium]
MNPIEHLDLNRYLQEASIKLSAAQVDKLHRFHEMLRQENERINVTRLYGMEAMARKHYVDSLLPLLLIRKAGFSLESPCMDLGSGGGFPGIPLAVAAPEVRFRLVEGRKKRTAFLEAVKEELHLENVEVISRKLNASDEIGCASGISRAFMSIAQTLELTSLSIKPGGLFVFWKGPGCDEEIEEAATRNRGQWSHIKTIDYTLPGTADHRRIVIYRKEAHGEASNRPAQLERDSEFEIRLGDKKSVPAFLQDRIRKIDSDANPRFKDWQKLDQSKFVRKLATTIVAGRKLVPELLQMYDKGSFWNGKPLALVFSDALPRELYGPMQEWPDLPIYELRAELFRKLDFSGTRFPLLLWDLSEAALTGQSEEAGSLGAEHATSAPEQRSSQILLPLSLPENLGACLRSVLGFGIGQVILSSESVYPFHPQVVRSSSGACLRIRFRQGPSLDKMNDFLNDLGLTPDRRIILDEESARPLHELHREDCTKDNEPICLAVGPEGSGFPPTFQGLRFRIPMRNPLESYNA